MHIIYKDLGDGFHTFEDRGYCFYYIHKETCQSEEQKLDWLEHLRRKNWWTGLLEEDFLRSFHSNG